MGFELTEKQNPVPGRARPVSLAEAEGPVSTPTDSEPIDILLVDDRPENLLTLRAVLENSSYHLTTAPSGEEALRYLLDQEPALILMDVQMPGMDGFETASIIKRSVRTREIPIIFITAMNKEERYVHQGYDTGAVDYIQKPYDPYILRSKVAVFAELARRTQRMLRAEQRLREQEKNRRERRIAELEIKGLRREQAEQRKYRDLVEGIEHGIVWSADPETLALRFVSQSAERISGIPLQNWVTEPHFLAEHLPSGDAELFLDAARATFRTGEGREIEHRLIGDNGRMLWFRTSLRLSAKPNPDESTYSEVKELRGLSMDVSRMREADDLLRLNKQRSDLLADASRLLGGTLDSQKALAPLAELLVPRFATAVSIDVVCEKPPEKAPNDALIVSRLACAGDNLPGPLVPPLPSHVTECEGAWLIPLAVRERVIGMLSIRPRDLEATLDLRTVEDLGRRVAASLDAAGLYAQAQQAISARDEFLSIASHELRTPLTPLKIQTQSLIRALLAGREAGLAPERLIRMLQTSDRQLGRLSRLIDDLLDVSRISMGRLNLSPEPFDFAEMLRDVIERYCGPNSGTDFRCNDVQCPAELPVTLDRLRVEQVVINLVTNALKYSEQPISIRVVSDDDSFALSVRDHGIGIAPVDQARIFDRFERATTGEHFGGLGLGLFIVGEIVRAHSGTIGVESALGAGATFTVRLPRRVVSVTS